MEVPPGPKYLFLNLPALSAPPFIVLLLQVILARAFDITFPTNYIVSAYFLSFPLALFVSVQLRDFRISREAAEHGAALPPLYKYIRGDWTPGNIWSLNRMARINRNRYIGELLQKGAKEQGHVVNMRLLFRDRVCILLNSPSYVHSSSCIVCDD